MSLNKANIIAVLGASESGKSASVKLVLDKKPFPRLLIWDMMKEYGKYAQSVSDLNQVIDIMGKAGKNGPFQIAFNCEVEDKKKRQQQFHTFCGLANAAGSVACVVDELRFVTTPQFAPDRWSMITCTGRHAAMTVIGNSQRPAQIDKDFLANCTVIRTFRLGYPDDRMAVAKAMNISPDEIMALQQFEYLEYELKTHTLTRGFLPWAQPKPVISATK